MYISFGLQGYFVVDSNSFWFFEGFVIWVHCYLFAKCLIGLSRALQTNISFGLPIVSHSTSSRIKKELFNNVAIKPVGSSFAKCSICNQLHEFLLKSPKSRPAYVQFLNDQEQFLVH